MNGSWRGVEIDDYLPVDEYGNLMCAYSNKSKLWVSLLEKAYLKAHGGYDFPGSNSSRDLFIFTGWVPEVIDLQLCDRQEMFQKLLNGQRADDCLVTCGTGPLDEESEEKLGLVSSHAYAILEIKEYKGLKMLMVKNPWGHKRYKGKFSFEDLESWTTELRREFGYNKVSAEDYGMFWIDLDTFCEAFENLYINWNPKLLMYSRSFFDRWKYPDMSCTEHVSIKRNP